MAIRQVKTGKASPPFKCEAKQLKHNTTMRTKYEVWQWSVETGDHTIFIAHYDSVDEAEATAKRYGNCIVVQPSDEWTPFIFNGEPVIAYPVILWVGGIGHVSFFSLFSKDGNHIGFVKRSKVKRYIDEKEVVQ